MNIFNYQQRIFLVVIVFAILVLSYIGLCGSNIQKCLFGNSILFTRTAFHFSLSILFVAPFLFFVREAVYFKWLRFVGIWFGFTFFLIVIAPEYSGNILTLDLTKKPISLAMSLLFIPLSLGKILWDSKWAKD